MRPRALEVVVVAFAAAAILESLLSAHLPHRGLLAVLALTWTLPIGLRRRYPFWSPLALCLGVIAFALVLGSRTSDLTMPFVAGAAAAVSFGLIRDRRQAVAGWAAVIATAGLVDYRSTRAASDFFWTTLVLTLAWFFGAALGSRTEQAYELRQRVVEAERGRALAAERAAQEERARIARELHDVVAHAVSLMVVQVSGVRRLLTEDQERERDALLSVEQVGREALVEMRRMLGVMRSGEASPPELVPQPGLAYLDRLVAQIEEAGLPVTLTVEGDRPELSPGIDLSAYRIVQEGLTHALQHAAGAHAEVTVRYIDSSVEVVICDDGARGADEAGTEHGLVGMRERVALYGGTIEAGPRGDGCYVLRARLPVGASEALTQ